jgi:hypothetical protein
MEEHEHDSETELIQQAQSTTGPHSWCTTADLRNGNGRCWLHFMEQGAGGDEDPN